MLCSNSHAKWVTIAPKGCTVWWGSSSENPATAGPADPSVTATWNGACERGKPITGKGRLQILEDGEKVAEYTGDVMNGKQHGQGKETRFDDGTTVSEGQWVADKLVKGQITTSEGTVLKGNFKDEQLYGIVEIITPQDSPSNWGPARYQGAFSNKARNGFGVMAYTLDPNDKTGSNHSEELKDFIARKIGSKAQSIYRVAGLWEAGKLSFECQTQKECEQK